MPLYVKLCCERAKTWRSYTPSASRACKVTRAPSLSLPTIPHPHPHPNPQLEPTVRGMIDHMLEDLEAEHGRTFAAHAFGCLTVAYRGLSDAEMEDILSCDEEVGMALFSPSIPSPLLSSLPGSQRCL